MKTAMWLIAAGLCLAAPVAAQDTAAKRKAKEMAEDRASLELTRAEIQAERTRIVSTAIPLTPEESPKFWPLYRTYRNDVQKLNDGVVRIVQDYAKSYPTPTDAQAAKMLDDYLSLEKRKIELQQTYVTRFKKILPATTVARLMQLENKMDAVVAYDLAGVVPLVPVKQ